MIERRTFLAGLGAMALAGAARGGERRKYRAAIIGHTGKGDYGHGMDAIFSGRENIEIVAVADENPQGLTSAQKRTSAVRAYADWRDMLDRERPDLVSIAPRQTPLRRAMLLGALEAGAHIACEKPFVRAPIDGDDALAVAQRKNLKIVVMHQMRLAPSVVHLKKKLDAGEFGELLEMRAWGKQDRRAGGEDMVVLGVHLFDLMRLFAGDPDWCSARVLHNGREATAADVRSAGEDIGPILGTDIDAAFSFSRGVLGTFTSRQKLAEHVGHWGIELVGSKGSARILADIWPRVMISRAEKWSDAGRIQRWEPMSDDPGGKLGPVERTISSANARLVDDWLQAIAEDRQPICSGLSGAKAVEMVMGIWRAGLSGGRMRFPLEQRRHALE